MKYKPMIWLAGLLVLSTLLATGCVGSLGVTPSAAEVKVAQAAVPRVTTANAPEADLAELVAGNSEFAFDLYQAVRGEDGNLFYSPYSISLALAMAYAGARGQTEQQMAETLQYTLPPDRLHAAFNALDLALASRGADATSEGFRLKVANSAWGQSEYPFLAAYLQVLAENYGAGIRLVDFERETEPARLAINDWVERETEGKIPDLLPRGAIDAETLLVLVNAIYFNAEWQHPFNRSATAVRPFTLLDRSQVGVPMMSQRVWLSHAQGDGYQAVELPYHGGMSMVVVMPELDGFARFEAELTGQRVDAILKDLQAGEVVLTLPKFNYQSSLRLAETLAALGMPDAFALGRADFSGMSAQVDELFISDVIHKAVVSVDEEGTEAAAATAVIMAGSAPIDPPLLTFDHPFIFLIRDAETGAILFVGRVLDPAE